MRLLLMLFASSSVFPSLLVFLVISLPARSTKFILPETNIFKKSKVGRIFCRLIPTFPTTTENFISLTLDNEQRGVGQYLFTHRVW